MSSSSRTTTAKTPEQDGVSYFAIRGKVYRIEELSQEDYEACMRKAEIPDEENEGATKTDMLVLERLVTLASVTIVAKEGDPAGEKLDPAQWTKEKYPVTSRVAYEVRRAHFMALTDAQIAEVERQSKGKRADPNA